MRSVDWAFFALAIGSLACLVAVLLVFLAQAARWGEHEKLLLNAALAHGPQDFAIRTKASRERRAGDEEPAAERQPSMIGLGG